MVDPIASSLRWSSTGILFVRLATGVRGVVVARVLGPSDTGLFAGVLAFVAVANLVAEFGLQTYLVSRGSAASERAREVFDFVLVTGTVGGAAVLVFAAPIGWLYDSVLARNVALALAGSVLLTALAVVPNALLRVENRFKDVARAQIVSELVALIVGIGLALAGAGVWALVGSLLASQVVLVLLLWAARPHRTRGSAPARARRDMVSYGIAITAGGLVWAAALHGDNVVIGRLAGATALGLYAFAYNYGILPGVIVGSMVTDVALASFANTTSLERRRELFVHFAKVTTAVSAPIVAMAIAFADEAVALVLGDQWQGAVGPLRVMLLLGFVRGLLPSEVLLRADGRVRVELAIGLVAAPLTVAAAVLLAADGILLVAVTVVIVQIAAALASTSIALRAISLAYRDVGRAVAAPAVLAAVVAISLWAGAAVLRPPVAGAVLGIPAGLLAYALILRVLTPSTFADVRPIVGARSAVEQR